MTTCLSPGGTTIYNNNQFSSQLMVATTQGLITLSEAESGEWHQSDSQLIEHHFCALLQTPEGRFIAGSHDAGIFVSDDGTDWRPANQGLSVTNVYSLAVTERNGKTLVYAGTEPANLFVSEDLGESWLHLEGLNTVSNADTWTFPAPPFLGHIKTIAIDPHNSKRLYACIEQGGLYRSSDAGQSWTQLAEDLPNDLHRAVVSPVNPERLFIADGFFFNRSDDGGQTWFEMADLIPRIGYADQLVCHPNKPDHLVVVGGYATPEAWATGSAKSAIYYTRDGGDSWQQADQGLPAEMMPSFEAGCLEACADQSRIFLGNTHGEVWLSSDEGISWNKIATGLPWVSKCFHADLIHGKLQLSEEDIQIPAELREKMTEMVDRNG